MLRFLWSKVMFKSIRGANTNCTVAIIFPVFIQLREKKIDGGQVWKHDGTNEGCSCRIQGALYFYIYKTPFADVDLPNTNTSEEYIGGGSFSRSCGMYSLINHWIIKWRSFLTLKKLNLNWVYFLSLHFQTPSKEKKPSSGRRFFRFLRFR